jgi:hypothetical protein
MICPVVDIFPECLGIVQSGRGARLCRMIRAEVFCDSLASTISHAVRIAAN